LHRSERSGCWRSVDSAEPLPHKKLELTGSRPKERGTFADGRQLDCMFRQAAWRCRESHGASAIANSPIRLARCEDLDLVASLLGEFYAESGYPFDRGLSRGALAALIEDSSLGRLWLILKAEVPIGYIAVTFGFSLELCGRDAFIDDFFIQPAFRRAGLGTRVLEAVEPRCRALGVRALHLEVERTNHAAQGLYRKQGFRESDRLLLSKPLHPERVA